MSKHPGILYAEAHHELIQAYLKGGRKQEARARARKTVSDRAPLFYDLGLAAERAGRWEEASSSTKSQPWTSPRVGHRLAQRWPSSAG